MDNENINSQLSDENNFDSESEIIHIDSGDIFHADRRTIFVRLFLGIFNLVCGLGILAYSLFWLDKNSDGYIELFIVASVCLIILSIVYFISAWHKRSYRSFINEQGIGCSNSHDIPAHSWNEVEYVLQRLYYGGTPPNNGVWGVAPRRLDEDYIIVLKSGQRLFFGRRNLGHLSRFKPLILHYSELNNVEWKTQEIYHSRKIKAGSQLIPSILILLQALVPLLLVGVVVGVSLKETATNAIVLEERFSWPIEFLRRDPDTVNQFKDNGSIAPLEVNVSSLFLTNNGNAVAFGTDSGSFQLRDMSGAELGTVPNALLSAVVFTMTSADNTKFIVRDFDNQLLVMDLNRKEEIFSLDVPNRNYHTVVFSADGSFLYFGDMEGRVAVYDLKSKNQIKKFQVLQNRIVYMYASKEGLKVLAGYENNSVYIWDLFMQGEPISINLDSELVCAEFTEDGKELGTLERNGTFRIWNYAIRQETFRRPLYSSDTEKIDVFTFSHDGKIIAYGSSMGVVSFLSIAKSSIFDKLTVPGMKSPTPILDLKFSEDDQYLFVGTKYGVWKVRVLPEGKN